MGPGTTVTQSVIDRLIDKPQPTTRSESVKDLKRSLHRDMEWLLNTRRINEEVKDKRSELTKSLYNYGLPDLTQFGVNSANDQKRVAYVLESAISIFEPRLTAVRVTLDEFQRGEKTLRFHVDGLLLMDPAPERISFDTVLELTKGDYQVKGT